MPNPVIVIPGIEGSGLENAYALPPATTWSAAEAFEQTLFGPNFDQMALDESGEADEDERVVTRATQLLPIAYGSLVASLRGRLSPPVYVFPYDWRYSIGKAADALVRRVQRLQKKKLVSLPGWDGTFDFVCHSLGGLVLRAFIAAWQKAGAGTRLPVGKIVFIATPHLGSVDAIEAMIRGETVIFGGRKEVRKMARTFPGLYDLLPRFAGAVLDAQDNELDIFNFANWQGNVTASDPQDYQVVSAHLTAAQTELQGIAAITGDLTSRALVVYGRKANSTLTSVKVLREQNGVQNWYDFDHAAKGDGDEVVPVTSALLTGVPAIEIHENDVGYFNLKAHLLSMHAALPSLDEVQTVTARFLGGAIGTDLLPAGMDDSRYIPPK
jgi:hypothetical protein